jgi:phage shock protein A
LGILERLSTIFKAKANKVVDGLEDPREILDYSFEKQGELINRLRRDIVSVVTAKKQLELQKAKLVASVSTLEQQARGALKSNREDLARLALERKNTIQLQIQNLDKQIAEIQAEQTKLEDSERRLSTKVEEFKTRKEIIKAQYSSAEAQVKIKESITGISEEMSDIGLSLNRAEEKTNKMRAKSQALDEMIDSGALTDVTSTAPSAGADIEAELDKAAINQSVEEELAKMKAESGGTSSA